ncbi:MAG: helix-turn-helix domain-containing protein [Erysipelotrichaceae bacterium]
MEQETASSQMVVRPLVEDEDGGGNQLTHQFGERIKHLRISVSLSQEELSFRSGLHRNYISDVERGRRNISLKALDKLAKGLGISLRDLF